MNVDIEKIALDLYPKISEWNGDVKDWVDGNYHLRQACMRGIRAVIQAVSSDAIPEPKRMCPTIDGVIRAVNTGDRTKALELLEEVKGQAQDLRGWGEWWRMAIEGLDSKAFQGSSSLGKNTIQTPTKENLIIAFEKYCSLPETIQDRKEYVSLNKEETGREQRFSIVFKNADLVDCFIAIDIKDRPSIEYCEMTEGVEGYGFFIDEQTYERLKTAFNTGL